MQVLLPKDGVTACRLAIACLLHGSSLECRTWILRCNLSMIRLGARLYGLPIQLHILLLRDLCSTSRRLRLRYCSFLRLLIALFQSSHTTGLIHLRIFASLQQLSCKKIVGSPAHGICNNNRMMGTILLASWMHGLQSRPAETLQQCAWTHWLIEEESMDALKICRADRMTDNG